ncbi:MAG: LacI family DNA-binding transcriptional regulator [Anaerohalosphaeraceae bacterium]
MKPRSQISLKQIAAATNLSISTVSRVLRNKGEISEETRQKVLECAKKFNYRPNLLIQGIQTGRTGNIGIMVPPFDEHWARVIEGIHDTLVEYDYAGIMLWDSCFGKILSQKEKEAFMLKQMHRLIDRRVDGVILWPRVSEVYGAHLDELESRNLPVVTIDHELDFSDSVITDERLGAELVAEHLYQLGHRRIAHLCGHQEWTWAKLRRRYFEEALSAYPDVTYILQTGTDFVEEIPPLIRQMLEKRPTAVFSFSDWAAFEIYKVAAEMGLRIPDDLSVVGYSDSNRFAQLIPPPLTTVRQKSRQIGIEAARILMERISGKEKSPKRVRTVIDCELVVRKSTRPI